MRKVTIRSPHSASLSRSSGLRARSSFLSRGFARGSKGRRGGFTMLELMVVIAIILVLVAMAAGSYQRSLVRARESVLKQDLQTMRSSIQQYTLDKQQGPSSLSDLVSAGYLREVPTDPITRNRDWKVDYENVLLSPDQTSSGITDVHSYSDALSSFEGTPYSTW